MSADAKGPDTSFCRGEIVGADFDALLDGRILVQVAVDVAVAVGHHHVVMQAQSDFAGPLPAALPSDPEGVKG